ncbi:NADP-dependent oxidoreductase [Stenotrophomonas sp. PS02298]|uniref:NADP-dependent oxidoreductase n=1 Tax=Stenotrophomonas sp. PS02298 TaxID=2991424 RepID=UPI002499DFD7|nr:NADP-dependent oxidoreductase [Stenotrophomonas sp. PS02298]
MKTTKMKAFVIEQYDKNETGQIKEVAIPELGDDDVLVRVGAASVNVLDLKIMKGEFKRVLPYALPLILGNDVAGTVVGLGRKVTRFAIGDQVYGRVPASRIGTFAEYVAVDAKALATKPDAASIEEAASIPLVALTAWQVLVETAAVRPGQKVLIHAGSGGVGTVAIQLAKHLGAYVATTTSAANASLVKALGADEVIDYKNQRFEELLKDYDVVLNGLGQEVLANSVKVLRPGGHLISISGPPTPEFARSLGLSWVARQLVGLISRKIRAATKQAGVKYTFVFMRADGKQLEEITQLVDASVIKPVIDQVFDFASTSEALSYVDRGRTKGKVVISMPANTNS